MDATMPTRKKQTTKSTPPKTEPAQAADTSASQAKAKGSTLKSTLDFLEKHAGEETREAVLRKLGPARRKTVEALAPTDEVPLDTALAVWRAADALLSPTDPGWAERAGAFAIESLGVQLYGGILLKSSPLEFLTQRVSLFRLYYHPGNMEVVEMEEGRAVLRLVGIDPGDTLFCRRQTGGLLVSIQLAGGTNATVRHARCSVEGDAYCEWELKWR
jgi:hypothetical protein